MTIQKTNQTFILWLLMIAISLMWGSAFLLIKLAVVEVPPFALTGITAGIGVVALAIWLKISQQSIDFSLPQLIPMIVLGTLYGWFPNALIALATLQIDSGLAGMIITATPLITAPLAYFLIADEYLNRQKVMGLLVGFFGIFLLIGPHEIIGSGGSILGQLLMLVAVISNGVGNVYARMIRSPSPVQLTLGQFVFTCAPAMIISFIAEPRWNLHLSLGALFSVLALGVFCSAIPNVLFLYLLGRFQATNVSAIAYLMPVWAVILGVFVLHESLAIHSIIGGIIVLLGIWIVNSTNAATW